MLSFASIDCNIEIQFIQVLGTAYAFRNGLHPSRSSLSWPVSPTRRCFIYGFFSWGQLIKWGQPAVPRLKERSARLFSSLLLDFSMLEQPDLT